MKFGSLNSKIKTHEGVVDLNQAFFNANWVVQAELLSDWMAELQKYYIQLQVTHTEIRQKPEWP